MTQPPPQLSDFRGQLDAVLDGRRIRRPLIGVPRLLLRSGTLFVQADSLASCGNMSSAGALRSTGITRRLRYYSPLRPPAGPGCGYGFPQPVGPTTRLAVDPPSRVSQVPRPICRRPPSSVTPGSPAAARTRFFTAGVRLHLLWQVGHSLMCNEAESGSLALRLTSSPSEASHERVTPSCARLATWRTSTYHG